MNNFVSKNNPTILNNFLNYLIIHGYSYNTINSYNNDLIIFFNFLIMYKEWNIKIVNISSFTLIQVKQSDIIAFLAFLNYHNNNTASSRQRRLSTIKRFYKWLSYTIPSLEINPTKGISNIEPCLRLPKYLQLNEAKKIQSIFTLENSKTPVRNNAIITLFLSTGLRVSELVNINLKDVNMDNNTIKIRGKGNRERIVYFSNYCKKELKRYLEIRNKCTDIQDKEALFINIHHKRLKIDGIDDICKKAYKLMGLENNGYTTHTLRHTAATIIYQQTNDIFLVKEFLGHSSIFSTKIYTHVHNKKIYEAVCKNPLNKLA